MRSDTSGNGRRWSSCTHVVEGSGGVSVAFKKNFSYIKSLSVASLRVSDYFKSGKWLQFIITIFNMDFLPIFFNQIAILSATLAVYRH